MHYYAPRAMLASPVSGVRQVCVFVMPLDVAGLRAREHVALAQGADVGRDHEAGDNEHAL